LTAAFQDFDTVELSEELTDELLFEKEALNILQLLRVDVLELSSRFLESQAHFPTSPSRRYLYRPL
jgi:hypothetical protein